MNADGTGQQRLTTQRESRRPPRHGRPTGRASRVALSGGSDGIWAVDVSTGSRQELTSTAGDTEPGLGRRRSASRVGAIQEGVADGAIVDGETLTLPAGSITVSGPGTVDGSPQYQWLRCNSAGDNCLAISGATGVELHRRRGGRRLARCASRVTLGSTAGPASATSAGSRPVVGAAPANITPPTITGTATAVQGVHADGDDRDVVRLDADRLHLPVAALRRGRRSTAAARRSVRTPPTSPTGGGRRQEAQGRRDGDERATARPPRRRRTPRAVVASNTPTNTVLPTISTTAATITGRHLAHARRRGRGSARRRSPARTSGSAAIRTGAAAPTSSARPRSSTRRLAADIGKRLRVEVTATNTFGTANAVSDADADDRGLAAGRTRSGRPSPARPRRAQSLSATVGTWTGTTPFTYTYQWQRCNASGASCANIAGATSASYIAATVDVGSTIAVVVTARNASGSATVTVVADRRDHRRHRRSAAAAPRPAPTNTRRRRSRGVARPRQGAHRRRTARGPGARR